MIKGTKMIVITKNKIVSAACLFLLAVICVISVVFINNSRHTTAFLRYEKIIDSELLPAKQTEPPKKHKISSGDSLLKHFFILGDIASPTPAEASQESSPAAGESMPMLQAEALKIDKGMKLSNSTTYDLNPQDFLGLPLAFSLDTTGPQVLIMHTHTTESFSTETYLKDSPDRNLDAEKNITAVGEAMSEAFRNQGIEVIHDKTVHDYPSYNGAYQKAAATINKNLSENSSIKVVLDVHRDGITRDDGTKVKLVTDIGGRKTAQIMLVVGTDTNLSHPLWRENFKFASQIQAKAIEMFPSLMRPIDVRQERFNEQLTTGSLIVEVGSNGNTLDEAIYGGKCIAEAISEVLKGN